MRKTLTRWILCAAAATTLANSGAFAQALADVVPGDAIAYVGWRGTLDPGPAYAGSHLAAVLKDSQFDQFVDQTLPAMAAAIGQRDPRYRAMAMASIDVVRQSIKHPAAAFVTASEGHPRFAFCVRAGADSAALLQSIKSLVDQIPPAAGAAVVQQGDVVGISFNYASDVPVIATDEPTALTAVPTFKADLSQVVADPTFIAFADLKAARVLLDATLKPIAGKYFDGYTRAMDVSGLSGIRSGIYTAAFKGRDWQTDLFVEAPAPRTGLLAMNDAKPFDPDLLKRVPANAYAMTATRFNAAKALEQVRTIAAAVDPQARDMIDKGLGAATLAVGKNITTDLLEPLGDEWASYTAPEVGGSSALGTIIVNKLSNAFKEKQGLASLSIFLSNTARTFLHKQGMTIAVRTTQVDGISVNYIAAPVIAPAWTIKDGYLYIGLFPQTVIDAARYNGRTIAENENFARAISGIGAQPPLALAYTDTRPTIPDGYSTAMLLGRTAIGLGDMFLAPTNEPFLPPLSAVLGEAAPVGTVAWTDDTGLHERSISPFPGAEGLAKLSIQSMYMSNVPMMIGALVPSLNNAREAANRVKSASNLRQIGLASMMYANENKGKLPDDFATILKNEELTVDVFVSPRGDGAIPPSVRQMQPDQIGAWANEHSSYAWLGKGLVESKITDTGEHPLAYEKPEGMEEGINILYADGHVEFVALEEAMRQLQAAGVTNP